METSRNRVQRYRARAARRPVLFWWQAFFLLGVLILLWSQLPAAAVLYETRTLSPLPEARASYVTLDQAYAAQALKNMQSSWGVAGAEGKSTSDMELGAVDLTEVLQPPSFLEHGNRYPGVWQAAAVESLPQKLPIVSVESVSGAPEETRLPEPPHGIHPEIDASLEAVAFTFPLPAKPLPELTGSCRFYLETDTDGSVAHLLLLSQRTGSTAVFEQVLARGRARGSARGFVDLSWSFSK